MATAAVKRYWTRMVELGCVICGGPAEVAHAHGGSIVERLKEPKCKGKKLARLDVICLPLCPHHHRDTSPCGLDRDVAAWETAYGDQAMWIDRLIAKLGVDVWALAQVGRKSVGAAFTESARQDRKDATLVSNDGAEIE